MEEGHINIEKPAPQRERERERERERGDIGQNKYDSLTLECFDAG